MPNSSRPIIRVETEESPIELVLVYGHDPLSVKLTNILTNSDYRVREITSHNNPVSILEKPKYIFFVASQNEPGKQTFEWFQEALNLAKINNAKLVLISNNTKSEITTRLQDVISKTNNLQVDIKGNLSPDEIEVAAEKIYKATISNSRNLLILGHGYKNFSNAFQNSRSPSEIISRPISKSRTLRLLGIIFCLLIVVLSPTFPVIFHSVIAVNNLIGAKDALIKSDFQKAKNLAKSSESNFRSGNNWIASDLFVLGATVANTLAEASDFIPKTDDLIKNILNQKENSNAIVSPNDIRLALSKIISNLGFIQSQIDMVPNSLINLLKAQKYISEIPTTRRFLEKIDPLFTVLPEILGSKDQKRTYLIVFQNGSELRPTGGFIGSYALVSFDSGKILSYHVFDIYTADGQLKGRITPPDEILHFLGQPSWYMRDANFSPDFPLTAKRLEWFLEKETGQKVDGVIAVNLPLVQKILAATGPINLPDFNETVTKEDFYQKTQFVSEINFFPGSTAKKDYVGAVAAGIMQKIIEGESTDRLLLSKAIFEGLAQKDLILYFNDPKIQKIVTTNNWAASLDKEICLKQYSYCLAIIDANFGANKANYFLKRSTSLQIVIDKSGEMENTLSVTFKNTSPNQTWPGGIYKNYLRFLLPEKSTLISISQQDSRQAVVSPILTADTISSLNPNQFLVVKNQESIFSSYGLLIEVPIQSTKTITIKYKFAKGLDLLQKTQDLNLSIIKQPSSDSSFDLNVEYPSFLKPLNPKATIATTGKLIYNTDLVYDRDFKISFVKQ